MSMSESQVSAFQNASGFSLQVVSVLWISLVVVVALLWCSWALGSTYRGWATGSVRFGALGGATARILLTLLILLFFVVS